MQNLKLLIRNVQNAKLWWMIAKLMVFENAFVDNVNNVTGL